MTTATDPQQAFAAIVARLTGPGGEFEIVTEEILGAPMRTMKNRPHSLVEVFVEGAERFGDRDYLVTADRRITFAQHDAAVRSIAKVLADDYGVGKGDRVAIHGANAPEWVEAFWAAALLGAIPVGFNAWWSGPEVAYGIEHSQPKVVVVDAKRAESVANAGIPVLTMEHNLPAMAARHSDAALPTVDIDEDDPAAILYTSGTTGRPKGAVHTHRSMIAVVGYHLFNDALLAAFTPPGVERKPLRHLLTSPLFHIASLHNLVTPCMATGYAIVIYQGGFDANHALELIERERVTNWGAVPTMANRLMDNADFERYDTSSLTAFALASAPSSPAFKQRLRDTVPFAKNSLVDSYGLTESGTGVAVATPDVLAAHPGSLGRPTLTVEMEIRDPLGEVLADGEEGEICVRSPFIMLGYWNDPAATSDAIDEDRWLHTGDIGTLENGILRLTTRRSDLILRGGENIYPVEIEQCVDECDRVLECVALGVPHEDLGQEVVAVVVTDPADPITETELRAWVDERLSYYKRPARWRITADPLPRNATGKVVRRDVEPV